MNTNKLIDAEVEFLDGDNGNPLVIKRYQEITQGFLDGVADYRQNTKHTPAGDYHRVASIPTAVVEQWLREGFDIYKASAKEILARLRKDDLHAFIATEKRI